MSNCPQKMLIFFLNKVKDLNCVESALTKASIEYQLKPYNILKLEPEKILQIFRVIHKKFYSEPENDGQDFWAQNELRIFVWIVVVYGFVERKRIEEFVKFCFILDRLPLEPFKRYFYHQKFNKPVLSIPLSLASSPIKKMVLVINQTVSRLHEVKIKIRRQRIQKNKWNEIAKQIFVKSDKKYFRTPKQCREQWLNHLDPTKTKSQWTLVEDYLLIKSVIKNGRKWSKIAKQLGNHRTQHMVKNRYKSLLNAEAKRLADIDQQQIIVGKIRQRLESHGSVKKYLHEIQKQVKHQQSMVQELGEKPHTHSMQHMLDIQNNALPYFSINCEQGNNLQLSQESRVKVSDDREGTEEKRNEQIEKRVRCVQEYWIPNEEPDVDDLDIEDFFIRQIESFSSRDNFNFPEIELD